MNKWKFSPVRLAALCDLNELRDRLGALLHSPHDLATQGGPPVAGRIVHFCRRHGGRFRSKAQMSKALSRPLETQLTMLTSGGIAAIDL